MHETTRLWIGALGTLNGSTLPSMSGCRRTRDGKGRVLTHNSAPLFANLRKHGPGIFYPQSLENALAFLDGEPVRVVNPEVLTNVAAP